MLQNHLADFSINQTTCKIIRVHYVILMLGDSGDVSTVPGPESNPTMIMLEWI